MTSDRVAVIVPVFDRPVSVVEAVDSILADADDHSGVAVEVVVVDDGSTDDTPAVVAALAERDPRVTAIYQSNAGPSAARNAGVAASAAPLVTFLDSDDLMVPGRLRLQVDVWRRHEAQRPVVFGQERIEVAPGVTPPPHILRRLEQNLTRYDTSSLCHRRDFEAIGGFDPELRLAEDLDLMIRLTEDGCHPIELDEVVVVRRIFGDNLVADPAVDRALFAMLRRRSQRSRERSPGAGEALT